ncbi:MAG: guanylate kinase [Sphingobacteriales bacterium]|jgi:guanylate kinase
MLNGKCIIFSAPSGSGKTTIVKELLKVYPQFAFSISATSRPPRGEEQNGVDYHFLPVEDFKHQIAERGFVEFEEVYENRFYGTLKSEIQRIWESGKVVLFDVDVVGGVNLKKHFGKQALSLFIQAPSLAILEERLRGRATDNEEDIQRRLAKAKFELSFAPKFDFVIHNNELAEAVETTKATIDTFLNE